MPHWEYCLPDVFPRDCRERGWKYKTNIPENQDNDPQNKKKDTYFFHLRIVGVWLQDKLYTLQVVQVTYVTIMLLNGYFYKTKGS